MNSPVLLALAPENAGKEFSILGELWLNSCELTMKLSNAFYSYTLNIHLWVTFVKCISYFGNNTIGDTIWWSPNVLIMRLLTFKTNIKPLVFQNHYWCKLSMHSRERCARFLFNLYFGGEYLNKSAVWCFCHVKIFFPKISSSSNRDPVLSFSFSCWRLRYVFYT